MKRVKLLPSLVAFVIVALLCSALSVSAAAQNLRWTLEAINPWSGVESFAFVVSYFLRSGVVVSYSIVLALLFLIGWGLYAILNKIARLLN